MKKTYMMPSTEVFEAHTSQIIAASPIIEGVGNTGDKITDENKDNFEMDARSDGFSIDW